jgi:hypothetical protein
MARSRQSEPRRLRRSGRRWRALGFCPDEAYARERASVSCCVDREDAQYVASGAKPLAVAPLAGSERRTVEGAAEPEPCCRRGLVAGGEDVGCRHSRCSARSAHAWFRGPGSIHYPASCGGGLVNVQCLVDGSHGKLMCSLGETGVHGRRCARCGGGGVKAAFERELACGSEVVLPRGCELGAPAAGGAALRRPG